MVVRRWTHAVRNVDERVGLCVLVPSGRDRRALSASGRQTSTAMHQRTGIAALPWVAPTSECTRASASRIACHSTCTLLDFAGSLERFEILSLNGSDCLNCFHSSASASQYSISEYSISFLASAACSRHIASNALNCFFEYMGFPVATQFMPSP